MGIWVSNGLTDFLKNGLRRFRPVTHPNITACSSFFPILCKKNLSSVVSSSFHLRRCMFSLLLSLRWASFILLLFNFSNLYSHKSKIYSWTMSSSDFALCKTADHLQIYRISAAGTGLSNYHKLVLLHSIFRLWSSDYLLSFWSISVGNCLPAHSRISWWCMFLISNIN